MKLIQICKQNIGYFYISFFSAGAVNMIPQLFFNRYYQDEKGFYLSITLILCSLAAVLGIALSDKLFGKMNKSIFPMLVVFSACFAASLLVKNALSFIILMTAASFACNYLYNYSDNLFLKHIPNDSLDSHIKTILIYQMTGYMVAPIFFSAFINNQIISLCTILALALLSAYFSFPHIKTFIQNIHENTKSDIRENSKLSFREWAFVAYSLNFKMAVMVSLSLIVYILSDYYKFAGYDLKSGIVMSEIIIFSGLSVLLIRTDKMQKTSEEWHFFNPLLNLLAVGLFMTTIILLGLRLQNNFIYTLLVAAPAGIGFGLFIKFSRNYASNMDIKSPNPKLLSIFNSMQNISGVIGYGVILLCWFVSKHLNLDYLMLMILGILGMLVMSFIFVILWIISYKKSGSNLPVELNSIIE